MQLMGDKFYSSYFCYKKKFYIRLSSVSFSFIVFVEVLINESLLSLLINKSLVFVKVLTNEA